MREGKEETVITIISQNTERGERGNNDNNHKVEQRERGKEKTLIIIIE